MKNDNAVQLKRFAQNLGRSQEEKRTSIVQLFGAVTYQEKS